MCEHEMLLLPCVVFTEPLLFIGSADWTVPVRPPVPPGALALVSNNSRFVFPQLR